MTYILDPLLVVLKDEYIEIKIFVELTRNSALSHVVLLIGRVSDN